MTIATPTDPPPNDLDRFKPGIAPAELDNKVVALEADLEGRKASFNKERFVYHFVIAVMFDIIMGMMASTSVFVFSIVASLIFLMGMGKWLDFPFIHDKLDKWERLLFSACERRLSGTKKIDTEPMS